MTFYLESKDSWECRLLSLWCSYHKVRYSFTIPDKRRRTLDDICYGSVNFIRDCLNKKIRPNYIPEFLDPYISRKVWVSKIYEPGVFSKPADEYKRFDGQISNPNLVAPFFNSDIVNFTDEWRYYVSNGKILAAHWYKGKNEGRPATNYDIKFPAGWCGAVDFGLIDENRFELIESHHPISVGWYGRTDMASLDIFAQFIIEGWKFINKN